ncbi:hypothetical protein C1H46_020181 [Malus baccata]|uniref:Nucleotide-diphospho-sugar transferase domain-containing protein n=1 Tax=Malus baccata TaxID=106549 RepID=A0A540M6U7_MALBA|nr:hypothetical protein C1H46_020181 [Malus baccata]
MRNSVVFDVTEKRINMWTTLVFMAAAAVTGCFIGYNFVYPPGSRYDALAVTPHLPSCRTTTPPSQQAIIFLDEKAYARCLALLPHCYQLKTQGANFTHEAVFTSSNYLQITWGKVQSISLILEKGYSFVITDNDIMWLRNPFSQFNPEIPIFKFLVITSQLLQVWRNYMSTPRMEKLHVIASQNQ